MFTIDQAIFQNLYILDMMQNQELLTKLKKEFPRTNIFYEKFDITRKDCIEKALGEIVNQITRIDVFVNGAGVLWEDRIEEMFAINVVSHFCIRLKLL